MHTILTGFPRDGCFAGDGLSVDVSKEGSWASLFAIPLTFPSVDMVIVGRVEALELMTKGRL